MLDVKLSGREEEGEDTAEKQEKIVFRADFKCNSLYFSISTKPDLVIVGTAENTNQADAGSFYFVSLKCKWSILWW